MVIDKTKPVMITGATGYVAGWIVKKLLQEGFTVHAPVRNPDQVDKLQHLNEMAQELPGNIKYFKADLLDFGSYKEAMEGCQLVYHTASPFIIEVNDPQKQLIDPALLGTRNILEEANKSNTVERVVLTSSCAAIYGDSKDLEQTPNKIFTEAIWNTSSSINHQPYSYSKTLAEKEAWDIYKSQSKWELVVINPSLVIGPGTNPNASSESFNIIKQFGDGTMKAGVPKMEFGAVDVRDLAIAHFNAGTFQNASGRNIISGYNTSLIELAELLREKYGDKYPLPKSTLPKWLIWIVGPFINKSLTRKIIALNIGHPWKADNSKSKKELSVSYRPLKESIEDFFQQQIDNNFL